MSQPIAWTPEELMAVTIAREVRDGETVGVGAVSPIPAAGCILAEQLYTPDITLIILDSDEYYPFPAGSSELHFLAQRGELDLFFLSGMQIDRRGNFNLHVIGEYTKPTVRMAGAYGSAMLYYMAHRVILFRDQHTRRVFVEKVDFVTAAGVTPENVYREGGPALVVTPKAVLGWDKAVGAWTLDRVQPGSSVEDVQANTGFPLPLAPAVHTNPVPTEEELRVLRTVVKEKMARSYPEFAREKMGRCEARSFSL
ncbi:MAG: CoA synthetase [Deltaproteobacteria bacterium]|nr:CoA synthetase [Deltaproteobacteria bacterium]